MSIAVSGGLVYVANAGPGQQPGRHELHRLHAQPGRAPRRRSRARPSRCRAARSRATCSSAATEPSSSERGSRTSQIDSFTVGGDGLLTAAAGSPYSAQAFLAAQGWGQLGSEFSPANPDQLFVTDAHTGAGSAAAGLVSSFTDAANGVLTPVAARRSPTPGTRPAGSRSATTAPTSSSSTPPRRTISSYSIAANGALTLLQHHAERHGRGGRRGRTGSPPTARRSGSSTSGTDAVTGFSVNGGTLTPLTATAGPAGATPSRHRRHLATSTWGGGAHQTAASPTLNQQSHTAAPRGWSRPTP